MVTVHRVGADSSGPLDSVRTDRDGRYAINYRRDPEDEGIYFAAAIYRGIAYFSNPLQVMRGTGEAGEITVFDTTSRSVPVHVQGHHVVVSAPRPNGLRDVVEVWELSNDTTATLVGKDTLSPVWSTLLPHDATALTGGQGDVAAASISRRGDRVALLAPFGPGIKQVSYSYALPASAFPLEMPTEYPTSVLEVLLEEPGAQVSGGLLRSQPIANTSGRTFKRWLGQDVPTSEKLRITVPATSPGTRTALLAALAGGIALIMAVVLSVVFARHRAGKVSAPVAVAAPSESLLAAIALLDARRDRNDPTLDATRYDAERAALKSELAAALAAEGRAV